MNPVEPQPSTEPVVLLSASLRASICVKEGSDVDAQKKASSSSTSSSSSSWKRPRKLYRTAAVDSTPRSQSNISQKAMDELSAVSVSSASGNSLSSSNGPVPRANRFPLEEPSLPVAVVTERQRHDMQVLGEDMIDSAVKNLQDHPMDGELLHIPQVAANRKQWKLHSARPNFVVYRKREERAESGARHFVASGFVPGMTLQDVEYGVYADTTADQRAIMACLFKDLFLDAAVLEVFDRQTVDNPFQFFGIKWLVSASPVDKVIPPRDYAYFEYCRRVDMVRGRNDTDATPTPMLAKVISAVGLHIVDRIREVARANISCTYLYHYDSLNHGVRVHVQGYMDPSGAAPSWLGNAYLSKFAPSIIAIDACAEAKYILQHGLLRTPTADVRPNKACAVCLKSFNVVKRHRHRCGICCGFMCSRCMSVLVLFRHDRVRKGSTAIDTVGSAGPEKFCVKCLYLIRRQRHQPSTTTPETQPDTTSANDIAKLAAMVDKLTWRSRADDEEQPESVVAYSENEDEQETDEERVQRLRQQHLAKEKQKNSKKRPLLRRIFGRRGKDANGNEITTEDEVDADEASLEVWEEGVEEFDFDDLLVVDDEGNDDNNTDEGVAGNSARRKVNLYDAESEWAANLPSPSPSTNMPDFSDRLERMERSIAQQEALIRTINYERARRTRQMMYCYAYMQAEAQRTVRHSTPEVEGRFEYLEDSTKCLPSSSCPQIETVPMSSTSICTDMSVRGSVTASYTQSSVSSTESTCI